MLSFTEENYLKALLRLTEDNGDKAEAGTNELAAHLNVKPATATDMLKKLKEKKLVDYERYGKISLTSGGKVKATEVLRKHRLWETFLYEKLEFSWDEVHEVAEQLEHIQSEKLVERLDRFLGCPRFDPHGDVIPNSKGELPSPSRKLLSSILPGKTCQMTAVRDNSAEFLQYVTQVGLSINSTLKVLEKHAFDDSLEIAVGKQKTTVSQKFADNIYVSEL